MVTAGAGPFGGCMRETVGVQFEEVMLDNVVYKRARVPEEEAECLLGLEEIDSETHNFKSCLEAATKRGAQFWWGLQFRSHS